MATYSPTVDVNKVIWITSLSDDEYAVTRRIHDDLLQYLLRQGIGFQELEPQTGDELLKQLDEIADDAAIGVRPIIHIDTHGNQMGLGIKASGETVPWAEIVSRLKKINVAAENNLCLISLACFGFHIIEELSILDKTPFYIVAGSQNAVYENFIESVTVDFYKHVFDNNDIVGAFDKFLKDELRIVHSERLAFETLSAYVRHGTMGDDAEQRIKDLVEVYFRNPPPVGVLSVEEATRLVREGITPSQDLVDRLVEQFLIGRRPHFKIEDVIARAISMPDPYADGRRKKPNTFDNFKNFEPEE